MRYVQFVHGTFVADIDDDLMPGGRAAALADVPVVAGESVYEINRDTPATSATDLSLVTAGSCGGSGVPVRGDAPAAVPLTFLIGKKSPRPDPRQSPTQERDMTHVEKIQSILEWAFEECNVSIKNRQHTKAQLEAMSEKEINARYALQLRRRQATATP